MIKTISYRFVRGAIASAVSVLSMVTIMNGQQTWGDVHLTLQALSITGFIAALSGGLLALDKYFRFEEPVVS